MKENVEKTELFSYFSKYKNNLPQEILSEEKKYLNRHTNRLLFSAKLVDEIAGGRKLKVLDVGIHAGYLAYLLKSKGHEVYGVDEDMHAFWGKRFASEHIEFSVCNLVRENLPFKDEEFDVVTFLEVIEHLPVLPNLVLQELKRVLRKGGFLILSTPNPLSFRSRVKILLGRWPYSLTSSSGHFREYNIDELTFLIKKVGLNITRIEYRTFDFLHMSLLHKILSFIQRVGNEIFPNLRDYIVLIACKGF